MFNVHAVLEEATKISATFYKGVVVNPSGLVCPPSVGVKFPDGQVIAVDRAYLWDEGGKVCLAMFPAELQIQYKQLHSDRAKVEALVALTKEAGWELQPNFHLAFQVFSCGTSASLKCSLVAGAGTTYVAHPTELTTCLILA